MSPEPAAVVLRASLFEDARVGFLAARLRVSRFAVVGALAFVWLLAEKHADEQGALVGFRWQDIDRLLELPGFCSFARLVPSWFILREDGVLVCTRYRKTG